MIIGGYRCIDCYLKKIDTIPDKPYMDEDMMKEYGQPQPGYPDPLKDFRGVPYIPSTGTRDLFDRIGTLEDQIFRDTSTTTGTASATTRYNPWFRNTWQYENDATSGGTNVGISTGTNSQNVTY